MLLFELAWPALWPALGVAGLFICLALFDVPALLPGWAHTVLLAACGVAIVALLALRLRRVRLPDRASADRRLERDSGLRHRPLTVLSDRPARADPIAQALWQEHVSRVLRDLRGLRVGLPHPGLARLDRRALRGGLVVLFAAALAVAGADAPERLVRAMQPTLPLVVPGPGTQIQAWITPPAYTRIAPLFLGPSGGSAQAPAGSHLTISVTGSIGEPSLSVAGRPGTVRALDAASFQAEADLAESGAVELNRDGRPLASWSVAAIPDRPPTIAWDEPPGRAPRSLQTRLPWRATDDYGVTNLQAEFRLTARPDAPPLAVTLPMPPAKQSEQRGVGLQDLTAHPWAGLDVSVRLLARDGAGQSAASGAASITLPERSFQNEVARALIGVRKLLSLNPDDRDTAVGVLDQVLMRPDAMHGDTAAYVNLSAIYYLLVRERSPSAVPQAQARLWELALHIEEGAAETTARALEQAREAVRDAMDKATQSPNEQTASELDQRIKELEEAIQRHMEALAEQARQEMALSPDDPNARRFDSRDLERMAEQARDAAREGRMDEARQRMAELERMLDQLRNARPTRGDQRTAGQRQKGRQQQSALQDMIAREGALLDRAQQRQNTDSEAADGRTQPRGSGRQPRSQFLGQQRGGRPSGDSGAGSDPSAQREADRRVQQALRRALGELMQQFGDATGELPPSLGDAEGAMRDAAEALGQGRDADAGAAQARAVTALQKGGQEMGQAMARQFGPGMSGDGEGDDGDPMGLSGFSLQDGYGDQNGGQGTLPGRQRGRGNRRDPLGRQLGQGTSGADEGNDVRVPEEMERQRTQAIQEELRRRGGERGRPQQELDYIERLLKPF